MDGEILNDSLVGQLGSGAANAFNDLICSSIGLHFLNIIYQKNNCPKGTLSPTACQTIESFCDFYNNSSSLIQKCLTDAAVQIYLDFRGIARLGRGYLNIGTCCARFSGRRIDKIETKWNAHLNIFLFLFLLGLGEKPENPPPACKSPETPTECNRSL